MKITELFDMAQCPASEIFDGKQYPWEILPEIGNQIKKMIPTLSDAYTEVKPGVWVGEGTTIAPTALVEGLTIIGKNCDIRHGAYLRGNVILGDGVVIGNSSEVKNCLIFNGAQIPHFNYVGDSVMGYKSHIGAGVKCSNLKSDKSLISIMVDGVKMETGLKKIGTILGDYVEVGCNCVLNPGSVVGKNSTVYPMTFVRGVLAADSIMKNNGEVVKKL